MGIASERKALEKTYEGLCTISKKISKKVKGETILLDEIIVEEEPCALSHEKNNAATQGEPMASVSYLGKLFIAPEIVIESGSQITVTQYGRVYALKASSIAAVYPTHQEINLKQEGQA